MLDVLLLSIIIWLSITIARRSHRPIVLQVTRLIFALALILLMLNLLIVAVHDHRLGSLLTSLIHNPSLLFHWQGITTLYSWVAVIGTLAGWLGITLMIHSLIYRRNKLIKTAAAILLITSPFVGVTFVQAGAQWIRYRSGNQFQEKTAPAFGKDENKKRRIVWIIFDEMDFRLSFFERPATLKLPAFDRLREESVFADNAYPPSNRTELSLPALINGRLVSRINRTAPNELGVTFGENQESNSWSAELNVFSRARTIGFNTGLAGWYHPYCRVIGSSLTKCSWEASNILFFANSEIADLICCSEQVSVPRSMLRVAGVLIFPQMVRLLIPKEEPSTWRRYSVNEFNGTHTRALTMATDPNLHLLLFHYSIPHPLGIYDRNKKEFSLNSSSGYLDNLALADEVLAQLRQTMIEAGVWENSTILISSDHGLQSDRVWKDHRFWSPSFTKEDPLVWDRAEDERVPFILRLAGEKEGLTYDPPFNTVISQDLILALLSGELSGKEHVVAWLDRHRSIAQSPYMPRGK